MLPTVRVVLGGLRRDGPDVLRRAAPDRRAWPAISKPRCSARRAFADGQAKNTYGTGCFLLVNTGARAAALAGRPADDGRLAARRARPTYALEGSAFVTGAAVQWLRDGLGLISDAAETEALAELGPGQRRRVPRAGVRRAGRAALGHVRARAADRADARHDARARGPRHAREHRLPVARPGRRDGARRASRSRCSKSTAAARPTPS